LHFNPCFLSAGQHIALDVARGLGYFHKHDILHLDIKSPNILLGSGVAKIADVGLGEKLEEGEAISSEPKFKSPDYCILLHALVTVRSITFPVVVPETAPFQAK
jgi:serine/threonine protein kinase